MSERRPLREAINNRVEQCRLRLASPEALGLLSLMGLLTGLLTGLVIAAFRWLIELTQAAFLPAGDTEGYEALPPEWRLLLPLAGGVVLGLVFHALRPERREVGIVHVVERLEYYQGRLPLANAVTQFLAGALSMAAGHSVGREGPSVHLGAASGSLLAQRLRLPHNTVRTMVACGAAAAIATSFSTPLAGVIFAMEVVMLEYTIASFIPTMLAGIAGGAVALASFGGEAAFSLPPVGPATLGQLPYLFVMGVLIGALAALFIRVLTEVAQRSAGLPAWLRLTAAGALTGLLALAAPQIMGVGYDTVDQAAAGELAAGILLMVLVAKLVATAVGLGLGLPGGVIGPAIIIGAVAGGAFHALGLGLLPGMAAGDSLYTIVGMGAMMGATLQAPLAALTAVLEMTLDAGVILPAMVAIVTASLTSRVVFGQVSVFRRLLQARGLDHKANPVQQRLRAIGVACVMDRRVKLAPRRLARRKADLLLEDGPPWLLVLDRERQPMALLPAIDLVRFIEGNAEAETIDLAEIPANRMDVAAVSIHATLHEALEKLDASGAEALFVERATVAPFSRIYGILTRETLENAYR